MSSSQLHAIAPAVGVDVLFWGIDLTKDDVQKDEGDKVKDAVLHPGSRPWILCCDRTDNVIIWDYSKKSCVCKRSLQDICGSPEISHQSGSNADILNRAKEETEYFIRQRIPKRDVNAVCGHLPTYLSSLNSNPFNQHLCGDYYRRMMYPSYRETNSLHYQGSTAPSVAAASTTKAAPSLVATVKANPGDIRALHFLDSESMSFVDGDELTSRTTGFCAPSRIMIVTDHAVIFYDTSTHRSKLIIFQDVKPLCASFVFYDMLSIGCSDGSIKIWDCNQWKEVKSWSKHTREVVAVKSIPILR
jgi:WD40 repeat protein